MAPTEADLEALRKAAMGLFDIADEMHGFTSHLDGDPLYLTSDDWGYTGTGVAENLAQDYDAIRIQIRDYLSQGAATLWAVGDSMRLTAIRYASTEASNEELVVRLRDDIPGPERRSW
jgi:hypothetical protein